MKLKLKRVGSQVFYVDKDGKEIELKINKQASKGDGHEVVYIKNCPESNGQTWVSLSKLEEGINEIECKKREFTAAKKQTIEYVLTDEEKSQIAEYEAKINEIIDAAKARYVAKPEELDVDAMSHDEKLEYIDKWKKYLASLLGDKEEASEEANEAE